MKKGSRGSNLELLTVIGSTGSLGQQTLDIVRANPSRFKIFALAANTNVDLLIKQIKEFKPQFVAVFDSAAAKKIRALLPSTSQTEVLSGAGGVEAIAGNPKVHKVVFVSSGLSSLSALIKAIKTHKKIALGTKELIVAEGKKIMTLAHKNKVQIIPIDSEHSAIFQCLQGEDPKNIKKIILTCSGGPFYGKSKAELENVTPDQALNHPTWKMGAKISIDSATLMNKGFEKIEAMHLFNLNQNQVEILIHPESIVHSFVVFKDGGIKAQMAASDMRLPISYALSYPERLSNNWAHLDFEQLTGLRFSKPDLSVLKGPELVLKFAQRGPLAAKKLITANEKAIQKFLNNKIKFLEIYDEIIIAQK